MRDVEGIGLDQVSTHQASQCGVGMSRESWKSLHGLVSVGGRGEVMALLLPTGPSQVQWSQGRWWLLHLTNITIRTHSSH